MVHEQVFNKLTILNGHNIVPQVLVKWKNFDASLATWEYHNDMLDTSLNFNLEDKVDVNEGSRVRNEWNNTPMMRNDEVMMSGNNGPCK